MLTDLVRAGKIRAFGCSTFPPENIAEAHAVAAARGLMHFRTEQPPYSILSRGIERSVLPLCQRHRMGVLTWSPLGWGFLTGQIRRGAPGDLTEGRAALNTARFDPARPENQRKLDAAEKLAALAGELGCSLPQLAVAFPLVHPAVTSVILGPRTLPQLEDLLAGARLELGDEALDRIDEIVPPGTDLADLAWKPPALTSQALRRQRAQVPPIKLRRITSSARQTKRPPPVSHGCQLPVTATRRPPGPAPGPSAQLAERAGPA